MRVTCEFVRVAMAALCRNPDAFPSNFLSQLVWAVPSALAYQGTAEHVYKVSFWASFKFCCLLWLSLGTAWLCRRSADRRGVDCMCALIRAQPSMCTR